MKLNEFKFSIILPTHNSALGIEKTFESLINQTLNFEKNIEIIVIDRNSIDNTEKICKEYQAKYPKNIKIFQNTDSEAKNIGLENISGEYVGFLENNDYLSKNTLEHILKCFKKNPTTELITIPIYYYKNNRKERYLDYKVKDTTNYNLMEYPAPVQLVSPATYIKKESIRENFKKKYNMYISFINELLLDNPQLGICKDGSYYMKNIEEKLLPTEDVAFDTEQCSQFVEENLNSLIAKSKNIFSHIPKFVQYSLLNQLKWILSIEKSKETLDFSELKKITQYIDDDVILNNILIENDLKTIILLMKYDKLSRESMEKLNLNTVSIDVYDIINNKLNLMGNIPNISNRDVELYVNGERMPMKKIRFPQNDKYCLGHKYIHNYSFEVDIPISADEEYELEFKSGNDKLNIDFSRQCNFSKSVGYSKTKHFLSIYENDKIIIKKKTGLKWVLQELKSEINMIKNHESGFIKVLPFRIAYMIGYPFLRNKKICFYMDRPDESDDNGLHLFKYATQKEDNVKRYYILNSNNEDYETIKKIGNVLPYKSLRHRYLGMFVENIITSHPDNGIIYPFWGGFPFFAGLLKSNNIFLQHGILKDNISPWLNKSSTNLSFFLVSSSKEYESIFRYPYNYKINVVQLKGLPRFDNLENIEHKKQIIIMPSWRRDLTGKSDEYILETEYFKRFNSLINNEKLIENAKKYNYEIIFRPHPNVYNFIELFDENEYVKIDYKKTKFQTLFNNGSLMITDYSSVAFDFAYLRKPVLYYQYGDDYHFNIKESYFKYETMGFGEVCKEEEELVDLIIEYLKNDCEMDNEYSRRVDDFFMFTDKNNCKRVHEAIKRIPLKD